MDMSRFVQDWKVGTPCPEREHIVNHACLTCPADKPVTIEIKIEGAKPPESGKILIARGTSESEELWAVRMNKSGRLFLHLGTAGFRETSEGHYPDFNLAISYSPDTGAISLTVRDITGRAFGELLTGHAQNQWVTHSARYGKAPRETWQLCLGCPLDGRADQPPIGWTISASFRFGETVRYMEDDHQILEAPSLPPPWPNNPLSPWFLEAQERYVRMIGTPLPTPHRADRDHLYHLAAEGADHQELSAEWHQGVLAGARAMGWKGGAA